MSDRKNHHLGPRGRPCKEGPAALGFWKIPLSVWDGFKSFWDLQSKEVWLRQESVETVPEEINLMEQ